MGSCPLVASAESWDSLGGNYHTSTVVVPDIGAHEFITATVGLSVTAYLPLVTR